MTIEEIYKAFAPQLTNYLVASGSSYATACDIVQETFIKVWKRRDELLDDREQVRGFVFTVARNCRADLLRKNRREVLQDEIRESDAGSYESDLVARDDEADFLRRLNALLARLPPLLRETFALYQLGELSVREIARQTNATETNVKVRIHRAKEKLREMLRDVTPEGRKS